RDVVSHPNARDQPFEEIARIVTIQHFAQILNQSGRLQQFAEYRGAGPWFGEHYNYFSVVKQLLLADSHWVAHRKDLEMWTAGPQRPTARNSGRRATICQVGSNNGERPEYDRRSVARAPPRDRRTAADIPGPGIQRSPADD